MALMKLLYGTAPILTEHKRPGRQARNSLAVDRAKRSVDPEVVDLLGLEFPRCIGGRDSEGKSDGRRNKNADKPEDCAQLAHGYVLSIRVGLT